MSFLAAALAQGCIKDGVEEKIIAETAPEPVRCRFRASAQNDWGNTKSVLTSDGVETRITDLTVAAYRDGYIFCSKYYSSLPDEIELTLYKKLRFHIYVLANMGDYTSALPKREDDLEDLSFNLSSYSAVNENGIPMAGSIQFRPGVSSVSDIVLERLFAKVTVNLTCTWPGGRINAARLGNINRKLKPFGTSAIESGTDVFTGTPDNGLTSGTTATIVLYVPENKQGVIPEVTSSEEKSPDRTDAVENASSRLSYLEVEVEGSGLYQGTITYRNYLGNNATDSFDIERNKSYIWNIEYFEDNLSRDEWKWDNDLTDTRYLTSTDHIYVIPGQPVRLGQYLDSNMDLSTLKWRPQGNNISALIGTPQNLDDLSKLSFTVRSTATPGASFKALIGPANNSTEGLEKEIDIRIRKPLQLGMTLDSGIPTPYRLVRYSSTASLTSEQAMTLCSNFNMEISNDNHIPGFINWDYSFDGIKYYLVYTMLPTLPGEFKCTATTDTGIELINFTAEAPQIVASQERVYLDVHGYDSPITLSLCNGNGEQLQDGYYPGESRMSFSLDTPEPDIYIGLNSNGGSGYATTVNNYSIIFRGAIAAGVPGKRYTATATYTYPNGYQVSKIIEIILSI